MSAITLIGLFHAPGPQNPQALLLFTFLVAVFFCIRVLSQSKSSPDGKQSEARMPAAPYWIPLLGNTVPFTSDAHRFLVSLRQKFGSSPVRILVGGEHLVYVPHGDKLVSTTLSSRELTPKPLVMKHLSDAFGMPKKDLAIYVDKDQMADQEAHLDRMQQDHKTLHSMLSGTTLNVLGDMTFATLVESIEKKRAAWTDWVEMPDLWLFVRDEISRAQMRGLCGDEIFKVTPDFMRDFWDFDEKLPQLFTGLPRWMTPKAFAARDKMAQHLHTWNKRIREKVNLEEVDISKTAWDPVWGLRVMVVRKRIFRDMSLEGQTAQDLGMIRASLSNAISTSFWPVFAALRTKGLAERVNAASSPAFTPGSLSFDRQRLVSTPLLGSMYMEGLRISTAVGIMRRPCEETMRIGKWTFKQNENLLALNWTAHYDETFWNQGPILPGSDGQPEYPVTRFWAERFLEYPDDPTSGPIRKGDPKSLSSETTRPARRRTASDDAGAKLVTTGLQAHYFPYGGGSTICPGRHFAKQEIIVTLAVMMRAFEIELLDPEGAANVRPDKKYFMTGNLPPDRKIPFRIRARNLE